MVFKIRTIFFWTCMWWGGMRDWCTGLWVESGGVRRSDQIVRKRLWSSMLWAMFEKWWSEQVIFMEHVWSCGVCPGFGGPWRDGMDSSTLGGLVYGGWQGDSPMWNYNTLYSLFLSWWLGIAHYNMLLV